MWDELNKEHLDEITYGEEVTMKIIVDITEKTVEFYLNDILIDTRNETTGELDFTEFGNMIGVCSKVIGAEFWDLKYTPLDPIKPTDPTDPSTPSDTLEIKTINAKGGDAGENKTGDVATVTKKYFAVSYTMMASTYAGDPLDNGMCGLMFGGNDNTCVAIPYDGGTTDTQRIIGIWGGTNVAFGNWWGSPCIFNGTAATEITPDTEVTILILGVKGDDGKTTVSAYINGTQVNVWGKSLTATGDFNGQIGWITKLSGQEATVKFTESDSPISATVFDGEDNETDDEPTTANNFYYTVNDDGTSCTITGFIGITPTEATIPATINGYKVTTIGEWAFSDCTSLTSITIPYSVTSIGEWAFGGCSSLKKVNYTGDVESWLRISFDGYTSNPCCYGTELYFNGTLVTEVDIPTTVTKINSYPFSGCTTLTSVTIGNGVTSIGDSAFYNCTSLTSITIPDSVTSIGDSAFEDCSNLTSITIPDSVTSIGELAFYNCTSLTSITIPDSVTYLGGGTFCRCSNLTNVKLGKGIKEIKSYYYNDYSGTFGGCTSLTSITIPDSVTSIDSYAFSGCTSLKKVYYNGTADEWATISIAVANDNLTDATRYYYSETQPTEEGNWWHYVNGVPTVWKVTTSGKKQNINVTDGTYTVISDYQWGVCVLGEAENWEVTMTLKTGISNPEYGLQICSKDDNGDGLILENDDSFLQIFVTNYNKNIQLIGCDNNWGNVSGYQWGNNTRYTGVSSGNDLTLTIKLDGKNLSYWVNGQQLDDTIVLDDSVMYGNVVTLFMKHADTSISNISFKDNSNITVIDATGGAAGENKTGDVATVTKKYFAVSYTMMASSLAGDPADNGCCGLTFSDYENDCVYIPYSDCTTDTQRKLGIWDGAYVVFGNWWGSSPKVFDGNTATTEITPDTEVTILVLGVKGDDGKTTVSAYLNGEQINVWGKGLTATGDFNGKIGWTTKLAGQGATVKFIESDSPISATVFG